MEIFESFETLLGKSSDVDEVFNKDVVEGIKTSIGIVGM